VWRGKRRGWYHSTTRQAEARSLPDCSGPRCARHDDTGWPGELANLCHHHCSAGLAEWGRLPRRAFAGRCETASRCALRESRGGFRGSALPCDHRTRRHDGKCRQPGVPRRLDRHRLGRGSRTLPAGWKALTVLSQDAWDSDQYRAGHGLVPADPIKWGWDWTGAGATTFYERTDSDPLCNTY
jgi:hypothetical protein